MLEIRFCAGWRLVRACLAGVAFFFVAQSAAAQNVPVGWDGFYAGVSGGGMWGRTVWSTPGFGLSTPVARDEGLILGGTAGFNWQSGSFLAGLDGDFSWSGLKLTIPNCFPPCTTQLNWLATLRGRLGMTVGAAGSTLLYVTAGFAFGEIESRAIPVPAVSTMKTGWTAGGGLESVLGGNWSARIEYLYVNLGRTLACPAAGCGGFRNDADYVRAHIARVGLVYRFASGKPPVVTK